MFQKIGPIKSTVTDIYILKKYVYAQRRNVYTIVLLIKWFRIGPVTGPRPAILAQCHLSMANTAD